MSKRQIFESPKATELYWKPPRGAAMQTMACIALLVWMKTLQSLNSELRGYGASYHPLYAPTSLVPGEFLETSLVVTEVPGEQINIVGWVVIPISIAGVLFAGIPFG